MPVITNPQTRLQLQQIGCLTDNKLDGTAFVHRLAQELEASAIAEEASDIPTVELTTGQLVEKLIGDPDEEVVDVAKGLLSTTSDGRVQKALTNGYVLCGRRSRRQVIVDGEHRAVNVATRFLSSDPGVIQEYVLDARQIQAERKAQSMKAIAAMVEQRQPAMASQVSDFLTALNTTWNNVLTTGSTP